MSSWKAFLPVRKVEQDVLEGVVSPADKHFDPYAGLQPKARVMF